MMLSVAPDNLRFLVRSGRSDTAWGRNLVSLSARRYADRMSDNNEDMKAKFREALAKKNAQARTGEAHEDARGAVTGTHDVANHKREFRRKSG